MSEKIIDHIKRYIEIEEMEELEILKFFQSKTFAKKENLVDSNTQCRFNFFVVKGCLRMFFVNSKGIEQTIQFAIENWWISDYMAFGNRAITEFTIQAVEKTDVMMISFQNQEKLLKDVHKLERYFRIIYQKAYAASQFRIKYLYDYSREEIYHHFNTHFPDFSKRIPQRFLASYLNMTPEYLSEIKAKTRS